MRASLTQLRRGVEGSDEAILAAADQPGAVGGVEGHLCHILAVSVVKGGQRALQGMARGTSGREVGRGGVE